jgi:hypothetical protein
MAGAAMIIVASTCVYLWLQNDESALRQNDGSAQRQQQKDDAQHNEESKQQEEEKANKPKERTYLVTFDYTDDKDNLIKGFIDEAYAPDERRAKSIIRDRYPNATSMKVVEKKE